MSEVRIWEHTAWKNAIVNVIPMQWRHADVLMLHLLWFVGITENFEPDCEANNTNRRSRKKYPWEQPWSYKYNGNSICIHIEILIILIDHLWGILVQKYYIPVILGQTVGSGSQNPLSASLLSSITHSDCRVRLSLHSNEIVLLTGILPSSRKLPLKVKFISGMWQPETRVWLIRPGTDLQHNKHSDHIDLLNSGNQSCCEDAPN